MSLDLHFESLSRLWAEGGWPTEAESGCREPTRRLVLLPRSRASVGGAKWRQRSQDAHQQLRTEVQAVSQDFIKQRDLDIQAGSRELEKSKKDSAAKMWGWASGPPWTRGPGVKQFASGGRFLHSPIHSTFQRIPQMHEQGWV